MVVFFFFSLRPSQSKDTLTYGSGEEEIGEALLLVEVFVPSRYRNSIMPGWTVNYHESKAERLFYRILSRVASKIVQLLTLCSRVTVSRGVLKSIFSVSEGSRKKQCSGSFAHLLAMAEDPQVTAAPLCRTTCPGDSRAFPSNGKCAMYGQSFDPANPSVWVGNCRQSP